VSFFYLFRRWLSPKIGGGGGGVKALVVVLSPLTSIILRLECWSDGAGMRGGGGGGGTDEAGLEGADVGVGILGCGTYLVGIL